MDKVITIPGNRYMLTLSSKGHLDNHQSPGLKRGRTEECKFGFVNHILPKRNREHVPGYVEALWINLAHFTHRSTARALGSLFKIPGRK